jgi:hypothetical protein
VAVASTGQVVGHSSDSRQPLLHQARDNLDVVPIKVTAKVLADGTTPAGLVFRRLDQEDQPLGRVYEVTGRSHSPMVAMWRVAS